MSIGMMIEGHHFIYPIKQECQKSTSSQGSQELPNDAFCGRNKEKSELCKKFMEQGYCPYTTKCKFAHGKHELRCNNLVNNRYKTRQCGNFFKNGICSYGQRCNFRHSQKIQPLQKEIRYKQIKYNFRDFFQSLKNCSRFFPQ